MKKEHQKGQRPQKGGQRSRKGGRAEKGHCVLAGAGPGDPGLITVRAKACIERADAVVYDALCHPGFLDWAKPDAEIIFAGKRAGDHKMQQDEINALLVTLIEAGKYVVRLKGGDPFVFGRGGEEAVALSAAGLSYEVVPGVSSAIAAPAYAGIPVTHRGRASTVTFFTGHKMPEPGAVLEAFGRLVATGGTTVMLMGIERLDEIAAELIRAGASGSMPAAVVRWGTTGMQRTVTGELETIAGRVRDAGLTAPAVLVLGEVVRLREEMNWFESRPLFGKRIVVTRTRRQASGLSGALRDLGADVIELPTIRIEPPADERQFIEMVADAHGYDWLVFTSANGVEAFFRRFFQIYKDAREIGGVRIAAIGSATASRVADFHLQVDLAPEKSVAEGLLDAFKESGSVENERILIVRPESAREVLAEGLMKRGAIVDEAVAYRTVPERDGAAAGLARLREEGADLVTFTSSSTVENFLALDPPRPPAYGTASIGPITSATLREHGLPVDIEAARHDIAGLVEAIKGWNGWVPQRQNGR
jgi:uroporphyrinogen III methyltransferase/synthase